MEAYSKEMRRDVLAACDAGEGTQTPEKSQSAASCVGGGDYPRHLGRALPDQEATKNAVST